MAKSVNDISSTTQQYLDIYDVSNDFLILKDGSTSLILTVSAMNFGLLAEEEQDAIMYAYAGLLNSLNYPIQIVIRSQTKDVTSYLQLLKQEEDKTVSDTRRGWIARYRQFVGELIRERNVLDKKFYVAIPASSLEMGLLPPSTVVPGVKQIDISKIERSVILEKAREILEPKRDYLIAQFGRIGLQSRQLSTQEIIQFFYLSYNPEAAEGQQITDTNSYTTALVQASMQGGLMDNVMQPMATAPQQQQNQQAQPMQPMTQQMQQPLQQPFVQQEQPIMQMQQVQPVMQQPMQQMPVEQVTQTIEPMAAIQPMQPITQPIQPMQIPQMNQVPVGSPIQPQVQTPMEIPLEVSTGNTPTKIEDVQNQIDSTLQELGQGIDAGATQIAPQPTLVEPMATPSIAQPTPASTPTQEQPQATPPQAAADPVMPELPEI